MRHSHRKRMGGRESGRGETVSIVKNIIPNRVRLKLSLSHSSTHAHTAVVLSNCSNHICAQCGECFNINFPFPRSLFCILFPFRWPPSLALSLSFVYHLLLYFIYLFRHFCCLTVSVFIRKFLCVLASCNASRHKKFVKYRVFYIHLASRFFILFFGFGFFTVVMTAMMMMMMILKKEERK